ncbi:MAG: hypothetical protein Q7I94_06970 [Candidatus Contubernalis sp.]|nr:hypothetical protein [Candidatus Contubernalis sp.]
MDNPQGQGYPQAPHPLGQRKKRVAHISTASATAKDFFIFKRLKRKNLLQILTFMEVKCAVLACDKSIIPH